MHWGLCRSVDLSRPWSHNVSLTVEIPWWLVEKQAEGDLAVTRSVLGVRMACVLLHNTNPRSCF